MNHKIKYTCYNEKYLELKIKNTLVPKNQESYVGEGELVGGNEKTIGQNCRGHIYNYGCEGKTECEEVTAYKEICGAVKGAPPFIKIQEKNEKGEYEDVIYQCGDDTTPPLLCNGNAIKKAKLPMRVTPPKEGMVDGPYAKLDKKVQLKDRQGEIKKLSFQMDYYMMNIQFDGELIEDIKYWTDDTTQLKHCKHVYSLEDFQERDHIL